MPAFLAFDSRKSHYPSDAFPRGDDPLSLQLGADSRLPITRPALAMDAFNLAEQPRISLTSITLFAPPPRIVAGLRHVEIPAHHRDRVQVSLDVEECKSQRWCFAKKALTFFKNSFDSLNCAF